MRSLESKETLKIQVPDPCSLQHFIHLLSLAISSSSSSIIYLSLNRKDELQVSSSLDTLQSLGVTSGDLIFYSFNPTAFSRQIHAPPTPETLVNEGTPIPSQTLVPNSGKEEALVPSQALGPNSGETLIQSQTLDPNSGEAQTLPMTKRVMEETPIPSETLVSNSERKETLLESQTLVPLAQANPHEPKEYGSLVSDSKKNETQEFSGATSMVVEGGIAAADEDDEPIVVKKSFLEPCFLRKVLREEVGDDGNEHKLLVIAVHAVMLESGFVGFDSVSGMRVDRFHLSEEYPFAAISMSLWYTLPELLDHGCDDSPAIQSVALKFQHLGQFINIYGSLAGNRSTVHWVSLDEYRFAPTLDLMWTHSDSAEEKDRGSSNSYPENEVFEFWKIVKDGLALPLLTDLCEKGGLLPPPCLMRLPTELKLKIFELLPGVDLGKVGCVCSELMYLSSNNDLWKQKFTEEFGNVRVGQGFSLWKDKFATWWENRKKRKRVSGMCTWFPSLEAPSYFPIRRDPNPFAIPPTIGGDYDHFPALGIPSPFGQPGRRYHRFLAPRNTIPRCNLGGFIG